MRVTTPGFFFLSWFYSSVETLLVKLSRKCRVSIMIDLSTRILVPTSGQPTHIHWEWYSLISVLSQSWNFTCISFACTSIDVTHFDWLHCIFECYLSISVFPIPSLRGGGWIVRLLSKDNEPEILRSEFQKRVNLKWNSSEFWAKTCIFTLWSDLGDH